MAWLKMPEERLLREALGFFLVAVGLFMGLALVTVNPQDLVPQPLDGNFKNIPVENIAGPVGAFLADLLLKSIGLVSLVWTFVLLLSGAMLIFGFMQWPLRRRYAAFVLLSLVLCGLAHININVKGNANLPFGAGGFFGDILGSPLMYGFGWGGAWILFMLFGVFSLVLTGNLSVSGIQETLRYLVYQTKHLLFDSPHQSKTPVNLAKRKKAKAHEPQEPKEDDDTLEEAEPEPLENVIPVDFTSNARRSSRPAPKAFSKSEGKVIEMRPDDGMIQTLRTQLLDFDVEGEVQGVTAGPIVTTYEFKPSSGIKVSKIVALQEDLARLLKTKSLRVLAPIPGKDTVGFEIPNVERKPIRMGSLLDSKEYRNPLLALPIVMGVDTFGVPIVEDLADMPHLLVAGSTGSGKSVFINTMIASLVCRHTAKELRLVMIDPKMIELAVYQKLPHMACPVVTDPASQGKEILNALVVEMEDRYRKLGSLGSRNLEAFNETIKSKRKTQFPRFTGKWQPLPYIVVIIDEFADLIMVLGKEGETSIARLAQKARAAGIHLVIATQRPSVNVVTGLIKANFPTRVAFRVMSGVDSRTILDQQGAETLLGKGDMLYLSATGVKRIHAALLEETEVNRMIRVCRA